MTKEFQDGTVRTVDELMNPLELFVRYGQSCSHIQKDILKKITSEEHIKIERMCFGEVPTDEKFMRKSFPIAFEWLDVIADGKPLDEDIIDGYFLFYHNRRIHEKQGNYRKVPATLRTFCLARVAQIKEVITHDGTPVYRCEDEGELLTSIGRVVKDAEVGEWIITHQGLTVRKISLDRLDRLANMYAKTPGYEAIARSLELRHGFVR